MNITMEDTLNEWKEHSEQLRRYINALQKRISELTDTNHELRMKLAGDDKTAQVKALLESGIESNRNLRATLTP
jgi:phage shock protein A